MPNIYLEKIALTVEDTRSARVGGMKAGRKVERKGELIGAGIGAGAGAAIGVKTAHNFLKTGPAAHQAARMYGLTPRKLKVAAGTVVGALGAINGAGFGSAAVVDSAEKAKVKEHTKGINRGLAKSAAVTEHQVRQRQARNDLLAGAGGLGGAVAGTGSALAAVGVHGAHEGMRDTGGYTSIKNSLRNSYQRKKAEKSVGKGATLMGKGQAVALATNSRESIARGTGNAVGKALSRRGLVGGVLGAYAGASVAANAVRKRTDASDVGHYKKLSKRNG